MALSSHWIDSPEPRLDLHHPYLRIFNCTVFVRDQDRSLRFFLEQLGFRLIADVDFPGGGRSVAVAPPDGSAFLVLIAPASGSQQYQLIGQSSAVAFITDDVQATFENWSGKGVRFHHPPQTPAWGGSFTVFEDVDGNTFTLLGFDEATLELEKQRRLLSERLEAERRAAHDLEVAKQVQARLFPQSLPPIASLQYAGICIQARQVGGDYYDFLSPGPQRLGLVVGDVAGKGIAAALLMANLQANVRSQSAIAWNQPRRFLQSVNKLFYDNTVESAYATLFFAEYDEKLRRLRFANCGHLPALLLRSGKATERLDSTGTVLGLFESWDCSVEERPFLPGDTLALYTDGITESFNEAGEDFGEERLIEALQKHRQLSAPDLLTAVLQEVQRFSFHEQHDDMTLIVAKCMA